MDIKRECVKHQIEDKYKLNIKKYKLTFKYSKFIKKWLKNIGYNDDYIEYYLNGISVNIAQNSNISVNCYKNFLDDFSTLKLIKPNYIEIIFNNNNRKFNIMDLLNNYDYIDIIKSLSNIKSNDITIGSGEFLFNFLFNVDLSKTNDFKIDNKLIELKSIKDMYSSANIGYWINPVIEDSQYYYDFIITKSKYEYLIKTYNSKKLNIEFQKILNIKSNFIFNTFEEFRENILMLTLCKYKSIKKWDNLFVFSIKTLDIINLTDPKKYCNIYFKTRKIILTKKSPIIGVFFNFK